MSDTSQGPGWWQASDGMWYPPETNPAGQAPQPAVIYPGADPGGAMPYPPQTAQAPAPGYWQATDGNWYPPQPGQQQLSPGDQARLDKANRKAMRPWYKKKRWWGLIVILIVVVLIIVIIASAAKTVTDDANKVHTAVYSVTGSGVADISYDSLLNGNSGSSTANGTTLPWTKTVSGKGLITIFSVDAILTSGTSVTCTITVDGKVVSTHSSTGPDASVDCTGSG